MITTLEIENFRCFKHLKLEHLSQINIIVGRNGSGKTALAEALVTVLTPVTKMWQLRDLRKGSGSMLVNLRARDFRGLWRHFFYAMQEDSTIHIKVSGTETTDANEIALYYDKARDEETVSLSLVENMMNADADYLFPLVFSQKTAAGDSKDYHLTVAPNGVNITPAPVSLEKETLFYPANTKHDLGEAAERFSELSKKGNTKKVVNTIKKLYPFIQDLSIELDLGQPSIFASVEGIKEKMPIQYLSEGVYRLLSILLGIVSYPSTVIIIDEIENGLYYETFDEIWRTLLEFAKEYNTQLFITTHSQECLNAAANVAKGHEEKFSLLRTEIKDKEWQVKRFNGLAFRMAIEQNGEVR